MIRLLSSIIAALLALGLAFVGWQAIDNVFADYQDSPVATYLLVGVIFWMLALISAVAVLHGLKDLRR